MVRLNGDQMREKLERLLRETSDQKEDSKKKEAKENGKISPTGFAY